MANFSLLCGDSLEVLRTLPSESIDCVMTSPPYWALRDYGKEGQLGLERTFQEYINRLCDVFDETKRVLKQTGTLFVNIGDCYAGNMGKKSGWTDNKLGFDKEEAINKGVCLTNKTKIKHELSQKSLVQIPHRFAIEMANRGWILRNTIIWYKPNCMPSSADDRFTIDFEYIFFFVKSKRYFFEKQYEPSQYKDREKRRKYGYNGLVLGDGFRNELPSKSAEDFARSNCPDERNKRCVWRITTKGFKEAHFAVFPEELCETPIKAGCPIGGLVLDPFCGSGTAGVVALRQNKSFIGIDLNPEYIKMAERRIKSGLDLDQKKVE